MVIKGSLKECFEQNQHLTEESVPAPVVTIVAWVGDSVNISSYRQRRLPALLFKRNSVWSRSSSFTKKPDFFRLQTLLFFLFLPFLPLHKGPVSLLIRHWLPAVRYLRNTSLVWQEFFSLRGGCKRDQFQLTQMGALGTNLSKCSPKAAQALPFSHEGTSQHFIKSLTEVVKECMCCELSYEKVPEIAINSPKGNFWQIWDKNTAHEKNKTKTGRQSRWQSWEAEKTTDLDLGIIQDLPLKLLSLRSLAGWMVFSVRRQRQKISLQSQRERPNWGEKKKKGWSV